jgi:hypothetical protein
MPTDKKALKKGLNKEAWQNLAKLTKSTDFEAFKGITAGARPVFWNAALWATWELRFAKTFDNKSWETEELWRSDFAHRICRHVCEDRKFDKDILFEFTFVD